METTHGRVKRRRLNPSSSSPSSASPSILPEAPHSLSLPLTSALISLHDSSTSSRIPVHEPVSAHVTAPSSQMELALQLQPQQLVAWLGEKNPTDTLKVVHETATQHYRKIKKRKQQELQLKVDQAIASNDKEIVRKQKKKNDNHASAVASRDKNVYIVNELDKCCRLSMLISAKVGASYTDVKKKLDTATKENEHLKQKLSSVTRCNSASNGSQGSTVGHIPTRSSYTQSDSPPSELNKAPSDDVARTSMWDASNAPIFTSNFMMHKRVQRDSCSQSKTSCRSSTISELTALPGDASGSESCGISLSNHINTTAPDIFGTLSASADNLEMFLSWSDSCTERETVLASATFQSTADEHLQKDSVQIDWNYPSPSVMSLTTGLNFVEDSTQTQNSVGSLQGASDLTEIGVTENDHNAAHANRSGENLTLNPACSEKNEPFEPTFADNATFLLEKVDLTCDGYLIEPELQEKLRKGKPASDNYALGA